MCGFAGIARSGPGAVSAPVLLSMAAAIRHRGPDGHGIYSGGPVGLAHVRLSIIDLLGGAQPLGNEDGQVLIVYNGEVYNYVELRAELSSLGHRFRTHCDTEVLVHAYEQWGREMLDRLNGQFAFAIYDRRAECVFLARDRFGIHPLFYTIQNGSLYFASEVKALLASGEVKSAPDLQGLDEVFTFWSAHGGRTPFRHIRSLEPGTCALWRRGRLWTARYYALEFPEAESEPADSVERLDDLMRRGVGLRMRADVPVGGYLSGGLDSSITCALATRVSPHALRTFSITFADDPLLDESAHQQLVARQLRSEHRVQPISRADIARIFPDVLWHTETPLVRTAPAPLYLLSRLTRENGIKVVLTGEGADEVFLGYELFKETLLRRFCLRQPASARRPRLFERLYAYLAPGGRGGEFWSRSFLEAGPVEDPLFSHLPRFLLTARIKEFYSAEMRASLAGFDALEELRSALPPAFSGWSPLNRAAYLEFTTLLSGYLLSSQGDRMALAHGVEGRFPFLDHRLFEFAAALPVRSKLRGLKEKEVLRRWARGVLPPAVASRPKQPYRAPDVPAFFGAGAPAYVAELLSPAAIRRTGIFDPDAVAGLVGRCRSGRATGFRENQALVGILSTQLWHHGFFERQTPGHARSLGRPDVVLHPPEPNAVH